jgi:hypothetical protein
MRETFFSLVLPTETRDALHIELAFIISQFSAFVRLSKLNNRYCTFHTQVHFCFPGYEIISIPLKSFKAIIPSSSSLNLKEQLPGLRSYLN